MKTATLTTIVSLTMLSVTFAQRPGGPPGGGRVHTETESKPLKLVPADQKPPAENQVEIVVENGSRIIRANNIPGHDVGKFPNPGNPNQISPQKVELKLPLEPKASDKAIPARTAVGIFLNGVFLEAGTGEFWTGGTGEPWNYEALGGAINLGLDENYAHVQPTGKYHYHGKPTGFLKDVELSHHAHSPLVGWAFDGFPIYALYGYADPKDPKSEIVEMTSSFKLKSGDRPGAPEGPGGAYDGAFTADYEYVKGSGTLDECNGRFTVTPEFPDGTYAYFLSNKWPVIFRTYRGTPAIRPEGGRPGGPPGGGPRGPGGNRGPRPGGPAGGDRDHTETESKPLKLVPADQPPRAEAIGLNPALFIVENLIGEIKTEERALANGSTALCYVFKTKTQPSEHGMGPWSPKLVTDGKDKGGIWFKDGKVYDLDGPFLANLAKFYDDPEWNVVRDDGTIRITETKEAFEAAARPDVDPKYKNHVVQGNPEWYPAVETTYVIPVKPVFNDTPRQLQRGAIGVAFNGVRFDPPAPVHMIIAAHTIAALDHGGGHMNPHAGYHYHAATGKTKEVAQPDKHAPMIGYALDGFAIYAHLDSDGKSADDLDECGGHQDETRGYHYHAGSPGSNQIIKAFRGIPGTATVKGAMAEGPHPSERPNGPRPR